MEITKVARAALLAAISNQSMDAALGHWLNADADNPVLIEAPVDETFLGHLALRDSPRERPDVEVSYTFEGIGLEYSVELTFTWSI